MGHDWFLVCLSWGEELLCQCYSWVMIGSWSWEHGGGNYNVSVIHGSWLVLGLSGEGNYHMCYPLVMTGSWCGEPVRGNYVSVLHRPPLVLGVINLGKGIIMSVFFMGHDWFLVWRTWGRELSCQCYSWAMIGSWCGESGEGNYHVNVIHGSWLVLGVVNRGGGGGGGDYHVSIIHGLCVWCTHWYSGRNG